jgi:hypothetical protein
MRQPVYITRAGHWSFEFRANEAVPVPVSRLGFTPAVLHWGYVSIGRFEMNEELKGVVGGIRLICGLVGGATTLAAVVTNQTVAILNAFGVAGVIMLLVAGSTWHYYETDGWGDGTQLGRVKYTFIAMLASGVVASLLMFFGRPMDEAEKAPGLLTAIGVMNVVVIAALVSLGLGHLSKSLSKRKKCPECANEVLFEARKCQFCQHRFHADEI